MVGEEEHSWVPRIPPDMLSQSARRAHTGPYRAAVVPAIVRAALVLPSEVAGLVSDASGEIARFDAEVGAQLAPFASILLRSESASSSLIEHLSSGAEAIAVAELGDTRKRNATEIVGNVAATRAAIELADHLDAAAILAMHRALGPSPSQQTRESCADPGAGARGPLGGRLVDVAVDTQRPERLRTAAPWAGRALSGR